MTSRGNQAGSGGGSTQRYGGSRSAWHSADTDREQETARQETARVSGSGWGGPGWGSGGGGGAGSSGGSGGSGGGGGSGPYAGSRGSYARPFRPDFNYQGCQPLGCCLFWSLIFFIVLGCSFFFNQYLVRMYVAVPLFPHDGLQGEQPFRPVAVSVDRKLALFDVRKELPEYHQSSLFLIEPLSGGNFRWHLNGRPNECFRNNADSFGILGPCGNGDDLYRFVPAPGAGNAIMIESMDYNGQPRSPPVYLSYMDESLIGSAMPLLHFVTLPSQGHLPPDVLFYVQSRYHDDLLS